MVGVGVHHVDDLILLVQDACRDVPAKADCAREGHEVPFHCAVVNVRHLDDIVTVGGREGHVSRRRRSADRRDVVIPAALVDVVLDRSPDADQLVLIQRDPRNKGAAGAQEGFWGLAHPPLHLLRKAEAKANHVAVVPPTLVGVGCNLAVDPRLKLELEVGHLRPSTCCAFSSCRPV